MFFQPITYYPMRISDFQRLLTLAAICIFISIPGFAQNSRDFTGNLKIRPDRSVVKAKKIRPENIRHIETTALPLTDCENDTIAPQLQCPGGNCLPDSRAAYVTSQYGEPWGMGDNQVAMAAVFGEGNWDALNFESVDVAALLSPAYKVIFLEGSNTGGYALEAFLSAHLPALENWVSEGGALFLNCAPNEGYASGFPQLGFGGVGLQNFIYINSALVQAPGHPVFNQPFTPANGHFFGSSFLHAGITGPAGTTLITDDTGSVIGLSEKSYGAGKVYFGAMTMPYFHTPQPNAQHLRQNILADLNAHCNAGVSVTAETGACETTINDTGLDATATDDCALASLTHDYANAPFDSTLNGAVLPIGSTLIRWTAVDAAGNTTTCETVVVVNQADPPVITCPEAITVAAEPELCGAVVTFEVTATDHCPPAPTFVTIPASGETFPVGETMVSAYAYNVSGNQAGCSFTVTVTSTPEVCNGLDDDCNGYVDDGVTGDNLFYLDADWDGYGNPLNAVTACVAPYGYVENAMDCDDSNPYLNPGMQDYCNGTDDNCDGQIDEGGPLWYADVDGDGYGDPTNTVNACDQPEGYVYQGGDCDDTESYIHPGMPEDCTNLIDENCDGILGDNNFTIEEMHTDVYCGGTPDGAITLNVTPAQNYIIYYWSNGNHGVTEQTGLADGTYKVTVTNECGTFKTKSIVIQPSPNAPLLVSMSGMDPMCAGDNSGTVAVEVTGGCAPYTYQWSTGHTEPSIQGLPGGEYHVSVTDACGCTQTGYYIVNEPAPMGLYFGAMIPLLDGTYFVEVLPYGGMMMYQFRRSIAEGGFTEWSPSNGFLGVPPGDYIFEVEDMSGCVAQAVIYLPNPMMNNGDRSAADSSGVATEPIPAAINSLRSDGEDQNWGVSLYPNPSDGVFTVDITTASAGEARLYITDAKGRIVLGQQVEAGAKRQTVNATALPPGMYFLQVVEDGRVAAVEKFIKE